MLGRKAENAARLSDEYQERVIQLIGDNSDEPITQLEMNEKASQAFNRSDQRLSDLICELEHYLDPDRKIALQIAQDAWYKFRTKHAEFCADQYRGGSIFPLIYASAADDVTITRIMEIDSQLREMKRLQQGQELL